MYSVYNWKGSDILSVPTDVTKQLLFILVCISSLKE